MMNPAFVFSSIWTLVLVAYSLQLSYHLESLKSQTIIMVVGSSFGFISGWIVESLFSNCRLAVLSLNIEKLKKILCSDYLGARLKILWMLWALGIAFEVIFHGGSPALGWIGIGPQMLYTEFGIPGFHGLVNSLFYSCCLVQFSRVLICNSKMPIWFVCASLLYPLLGMSRQIFISLFLQYLFVYLSIRRPSPFAILRVIIFLFLVLIVFGYLGDVRSGRDHIIALSAPTFPYPEWLPSAFIWVYIYLVTPIGNVNFNIDIIPHYFPLETMGTFIPSFARDTFFSELGVSRNWDLVTDSFNVSSLLQSLLVDFGVPGSIVFCAILGFLSTRLMRRSAVSPSAYFALIIILHGLTLSFFANLLFHLVFIFEMIIIGWIVSVRRL